MKAKNPYKDTIEVYRQRGKDYLKKIEKFPVKELPNFIRSLPKRAKILDVGCASGRDSKIFAREGFKVIGIDLVDVFLREARKKVPQAKFIKMDVRKLKLLKNYFDAIWANAVLFHLEKKDIPPVLKTFYRILKPDGKLHIRVRKGRGTKYLKEKITDNKKRLFTFFTKPELENLVRKAGFRILSSGFFSDEMGRKNVHWVGVEATK